MSLHQRRPLNCRHKRIRCQTKRLLTSAAAFPCATPPSSASFSLLYPPAERERERRAPACYTASIFQQTDTHARTQARARTHSSSLGVSLRSELIRAQDWGLLCLIIPLHPNHLCTFLITQRRTVSLSTVAGLHFISALCLDPPHPTTPLTHTHTHTGFLFFSPSLPPSPLSSSSLFIYFHQPYLCCSFGRLRGERRRSFCLRRSGVL